jgi:TonB family protein
MSNTTGKIVIRAVLSSSGKVDRIEIVERMPNGATEGAVEALQNFKFIPATKDGKFVSQYVKVEYHFHLL